MEPTGERNHLNVIHVKTPTMLLDRLILEQQEPVSLM